MRRPDGATRWNKGVISWLFGVYATEIRPFVSVAAVTCPGEIAEFGLSSMLTRHDVFEMKGLERREPVRKVAVFAAPSGTLANLLTQGGVVHTLPARELLLALRFQA
jgi:hypothetical protein